MGLLYYRDVVYNDMKPNWTSPLAGLVYIAALLVFVEVYHIAVHEKSSKTYSEWIRALPADIRGQLRDRR